jgi:hypothetical protein
MIIDNKEVFNVFRKRVLRSSHNITSILFLRGEKEVKQRKRIEFEVEPEEELLLESNLL